MTTLSSIKPVIDRPRWRSEPWPLGANAAGSCLAYDMRNDETRHPFMYYFRSISNFELYDPVHGDWSPLQSPVMAGTFGAGACSVYTPSLGPVCAISAGATNTAFSITTALPAVVGSNQMANRGDSVGFTVRITGNNTGGSGKTEERTIVANTGGTTPTITLDAPLSFVPGTGSTCTFLSGRVYLLNAGISQAGVFKYYEVLTNSYVTSAHTALPATISTDSSMIALSELYVPYDRKPGEGFVPGNTTYDNGKFNCIQATASSATTITGSGMYSDLLADEYKSGQIRIVEDTVNPTAVGQRRGIASHTAGAGGVFTVAAWAVTPSTSAKFVVENDNDKLLLSTTGSTGLYEYSQSANTWIGGYSTGGVSHGAGVILEQSFGINRSPSTGALHMNVFRVRGGATFYIDIINISVKTWSNFTYGNMAQGFGTGTSGAYDPVTNEGKYLYINVNGTSRMARFDMRNRCLEASAFIENTQGTALVGGKLAFAFFVDGATKMAQLYHLLHTSSSMISFTVPISQVQKFPTFNTAISDFTPAANATDVISIVGSAYKQVKIWNVTISGAATAAALSEVYLVRRNTANTGGASTLANYKSMDTTDGLSTASVLVYSTNPTALGAGSVVKSDPMYLPALSSPTAQPTKLIYEFGNNDKKPMILRGPSDSLCINFGGATIPAGTNLHVNIEYTEE